MTPSRDTFSGLPGLLGINLLEVMTRYRPAVQGTLEEVLEPRRPAPTRTVPQDVTPPPHRMPGN